MEQLVTLCLFVVIMGVLVYFVRTLFFPALIFLIIYGCVAYDMKTDEDKKRIKEILDQGKQLQSSFDIPQLPHIKHYNS